VAQEQIVFRRGSFKFEAGTHNLLGIVGLVEAMRMIMEIGVEAIGRELLRKREWLVPALQREDYTVVQADAPVRRGAGFFPFFGRGLIWRRLHQKLLDANIITSLREIGADRNTSVVAAFLQYGCRTQPGAGAALVPSRTSRRQD
jgi:selenocysteine lyase/cysteine desulfurase